MGLYRPCLIKEINKDAVVDFFFFLMHLLNIQAWDPLKSRLLSGSSQV